MSCKICQEYERWKDRLDDDRPLTADERRELRDFLISQQDAHIEGAVE
jgi:hypothetical protein